jgi:gliding motility-associated-like protein
MKKFFPLAVWFLFISPVINGQSACPDNIDFESGTYRNWQCSIGAVTEDNGQNVITLQNCPPEPGRHSLIDFNTAGFDYYGGFLEACPYGGRYSIKLGNDNVGNEAEGISYTFQIPVTEDTFSLTYYYAVVFEDPAHDLYQQPRFFVSAYDVETGRVIDCASYDYVSNGTIPGFLVSPRSNSVLYKEWTPSSIDFAGYAGRTVRLEFKTADCTLGGHFGYAYLDVGTGCGGVMALGALCEGADSVVLTAPYGFASYTWHNQDYSAVIGTSRLVTMRPPPASSERFHVDMIPYPGYGCRDTAHAEVTILPIPDTPSTTDVYYCQGDFPTPLKALPWPAHELMWYTAANGGIGSTRAPTPSTAVAGTFNYWVSQRSLVGGCEGERKKMSVIVSPSPTVSFTINDDDQCLIGNNFIFNNSSTGTISVSLYEWDFDTGDTAQGQSVNHIYADPGRYQVTLKTTNPPGCIKSASQYVSVIDKPIAAFSNPPVICENETPVLLQDNSTVPGGLSSITNWWWQIGSNIVTTKTPASFINDAGTLPVKLVVTTTDGCRSDTASKTLSIKYSPLPKFTTTATCDNEVIHFTDLSAMPAASTDNVVKWKWTYNGNPLSTSQHPATFLPAGTHHIILEAESNQGCHLKTADSFIVVYPKPLISLNISDSCVFRNISYNAAATTSVPVSKWLWDLGYGLGEGDASFVRRFNSEDYHVITLIGQSDHGCKDTIIRPFTIYYNRSRAQRDTVAAKDEPVQLLTSNDINMLWYKWTPSTGLNSDKITNPVATYDLDQVYELNTLTKQGCDSRSKILVRRYKGPELYVAGAFTPNGDGTNDVLHVFPVGISSFDYFAIYNRAGQLLFKTTNYYIGWDGTHKGAYVDPGNYVWVARAIDYKGNVMMKRGNAVLLR